MLGIADDEFIRGNLPMTKEEIRILTLSKARIVPDDIIVDIGAGTGSLSIEAARLAFRGRVYAIEKNPQGIELIQSNALKFKIENIFTILDEAPKALDTIFAADVILISGSGGKLKDILKKSGDILKIGGRLIINAVTVETLTTSLNVMRDMQNYTIKSCGVQITRIEPIGNVQMFKSLNLVYIISCTKTSQESVCHR